jgi:tRNA-2-methylthio-N6-dimethylallyladenosine synthase
LIVGFPTESEEDFQDTLAAARRIRFHGAFSFCYSARPNTTAIVDFDPSALIAEETSRERLAALQECQNRICEEINQQLVGQVVGVLVDGTSKNISSGLRGRIPHNTIVEFSGPGIAQGSIVRVRIERASPRGLKGTLADER